MFQMTAFVCGLVGYPGMDEDGCKLFTNSVVFDSLTVCEENLTNSGLTTLGMFLGQRGQGNAEIQYYECVAKGESA